MPPAKRHAWTRGADSETGNDGTLAATEAQVYLKADKASPAFTGTPTAPAAAVSVNSTRIATTAAARAVAKNDAWPVGSFYTQYPLAGQSAIASMFPSPGSPATLFGGTRTEMYAELVAEGLAEVPAGLKLNADGAFEPTAREERVIAGLGAPEPGFKAEGGKITAISLSEKVAAGIVTEEEYAAAVSTEAEAELNRRLVPLNTEEAKAMAEVDPEFAAGRKSKLLALLRVKQQAGWPLNVEWPEEWPRLPRLAGRK